MVFSLFLVYVGGRRRENTSVALFYILDTRDVTGEGKYAVGKQAQSEGAGP
jgi:hypothetical protein